MFRPLLSLLIALTLSAQAFADVTVATTIRPLQFIADAIVGTQGRVVAIIDEQDSPHNYSISPSDRINLERADLLVWIGPEFEIFLNDIFEIKSSTGNVINVSNIAGLTIQTLAAQQNDPHLWLDTDNAVLIAEQLANRLIDLDVSNSEIYLQNLATFRRKMENTNQEITALLSEPADDTYLVYHNAYQYFEKQFGLSHQFELLSDPEIQPSMRDILALRNRVQELTPSCLLKETDSNPALIATMLGGHELKQITIDLLGYLVDEGSDAYPQLMKNVATSFANCLFRSN